MDKGQQPMKALTPPGAQHRVLRQAGKYPPGKWTERGDRRGQAEEADTGTAINCATN